MELGVAFSGRRQWFINSLTIAALTGTFLMAVCLCQLSATELENWSDSVYRYMPLTATYFFALTAGYIWLRSRMRDLSLYGETFLAAPLVFCGFFLLAGTITISLADPLNSMVWIAVGSAMSLAAPLYLIPAIFVVLRGWEAHRERPKLAKVTRDQWS